MVLILGIFLTLLLTPVAEPGPAKVLVAPQSYSISGYVVDDRRVPIVDLQVELLNDIESVIQRTKTDSSGLFKFHRLSAGVFQVRIQTYGSNYIGQTKRLQLEPTRSFEQVDFVLGSKTTASGSTTVGTVFSQEVPEPARKEYERATALLRKSEQRKQGLETLKKAIELFPSYFDALELLGTEYVKDQEYDAAIPLLTKAVEVNKRAHQSLYALSIAQHQLKQVPQAIESIRSAVNLNQKSSAANLWLGMLLRQTNKLEEAETYLKQADRLAESKLPDPHWQLALLYNQLKRYKEAADELELFLKVQPDSKDVELIKKLIERFRQQAAGSK